MLAHYLFRGDWYASLLGKIRDGLNVIAQVTLATTQDHRSGVTVCLDLRMPLQQQRVT